MKIISLFGDIIENSKEIDNFDCYTLNISLKNRTFLTEDFIKRLQKMTQKDDKLSFAVKVNEGELIYFEDDYKSFIEHIEVSETLDNRHSYFMELKITKRNTLNIISIYSLYSFINYIRGLEPIAFLRILYNKTLSEKLILKVIDENINESIGNKIIITNLDYEFAIPAIYDETIKTKRMQVCNYLNSSMFDFKPEDFQFSDSNELSKILEKFKYLISLLYIFNLSEFKDSYLFIKIDGYKTFQNKIKISDIDYEKISIYYDIYKWIYTDGNISDRIGLSRNIISLYLDNDDKFELKSSVMESIRSSYEIYLKENVAQYIEIRSKLAQALKEMSQNTDNIVETFISTFKSNLVAAITFFLSVLIMNCIYSGHASNIFKGDIVKISLAMIVLSGLFLWFSRISIKRNIHRFNTRYERLKDSYKNFLTDDDINNIFLNDKHHKEDAKYINKEISNYSYFWIAFLVILLIVVVG